MPSFLIQTCWNLQFFFVNLTTCLLEAEIFALIHWQTLDVRKTKCAEKIGLKLDFGNCEKTKVFLTWHLCYFLFKLL